jgi:hypothetical protein
MYFGDLFINIQVPISKEERTQPIWALPVITTIDTNTTAAIIIGRFTRDCFYDAASSGICPVVHILLRIERW